MIEQMEEMRILETKKKESINLENLVKQTFPVTGMSCASCASSVESMLNNTEGVYKASVNFASSSVLVEYDESTATTKLQDVVREIGYDLVISSKDIVEEQKQIEIEGRSQRLEISTGNISPGLYLLQLRINDEVYSTKVMIESR